MNENIVCRTKIIKDHMQEKDISLNKLAVEIGVSPSTLSRVLNRQRNPGQMVIGKMLKYFGLKFDDLFFYNFELTKVHKKKSKKIS